MSNFLFAFFLLRLPRERIFMCCLEKLNSRAMLPKYKSCSFCPKLPYENNNRQWSWREQKEEVKKNSIWSIELNFMQPCNFTHWSTRSCSCTCDWHPLNGSLPLLLQNSPENSAYTVKFVFRFLLPKLIKTNGLVFGAKNQMKYDNNSLYSTWK